MTEFEREWAHAEREQHARRLYQLEREMIAKRQAEAAQANLRHTPQSQGASSAPLPSAAHLLLKRPVSHAKRLLAAIGARVCAWRFGSSQVVFTCRCDRASVKPLCPCLPSGAAKRLMITNVARAIARVQICRLERDIEVREAQQSSKKAVSTSMCCRHDGHQRWLDQRFDTNAVPPIPIS